MRWHDIGDSNQAGAWPPPSAPGSDGDWLSSPDSDDAPDGAAPTVPLEEALSLRAQIGDLERQLSSALAKLEPERQSAYERGRAEARAEASNQWAAAFDNLNRTLCDVVGVKARYRRDIEDDAVRLSLAIARKVLNREIAADPEALAGLVHVALGRINQRELHRVRVHPEDAARVKEHLTRAGCPERVDVIPEVTLERGALVLETERGELDASVQSQLNEIDRGLTDLLRHHR